MTQRRYSILLFFITLFFSSLFVALGIWQLQRAQQEAKHRQVFQTRANQGYLSATDLAGLDSPGNFPVKVSGHFDNAHSLLIDNRMRQGHAGYDVITPFTTIHGHTLLVNRGWLARGKNRKQLPVIPIIQGKLTLWGRSHLPEKNPFMPAPQASAQPHWPQRLLEIHLPLLEAQLQQPLLPVTLQLQHAKPASALTPLPHDWQQPRRMTPARHRGYAYQWFAFALIALGIYAVRRLRRASKKGNP